MEKVIAYTRVSEAVRDKLAKKYNVDYFENYEYIDDERFRIALEEAVGVIGLELKVTNELLGLAPNLKIVSNVSVGYDNLDIDAMTKYGVMATNTPGVLTDTVADAVVGLMLATARRIPELDQFVKRGEWKEYLRYDQFGTDVHHKTVGIIGMGGIGQEVAKRCFLGFNMNVLYYNRSRKFKIEQLYEATYCSLEELLTQSDYIVLMVPYTPDTEKMIGKKEFAMMKDSAIFINASRGKNIDEIALFDALKKGELLGAGIDVFVEEPVPKSNPLLALPNIVTTPHIGAATIENELVMSQLAAENLLRGLAGLEPPNLINKSLFNK